MKKFIDKIWRYLEERNRQRAENFCKLAYEQLQENGIEVHTYAVEHYDKATMWQVLTGQATYTVKIEIYSEKRYTLRMMCNLGTREEDWLFADDRDRYNTNRRTLQEIIGEIRRPCKKYARKRYNWEKQYLKQTDFQQYVDTYMHHVRA